MTRLLSVCAHAWRVRSLRPAVFAVLNTLAVGPLRKVWLKEVPWHAGKFVERRGNVVWLDNCRVDVSAGLFSTFQRGCLWLHRHEEPERLAIGRFLESSRPVIELGASTGTLSCLINRRLRDPRQHVAVELNPALIPVIENNRALNACQFTVIHAAVGDPDTPPAFAVGDDHLAGHASAPSGQEEVIPVVTLDALLERFPGERVTLVCDIEGTEIDLWKRSQHLFPARVEWFIVEVHEDITGVDAIEAMTRGLMDRGFDQVWVCSATRVFRNVRYPESASPSEGLRRGALSD